MQGLQYFSSVPVLHYLQTILFIEIENNFHEYLIQHSLKSGISKDHFRWVKVPDTAPYWAAWKWGIFLGRRFTEQSYNKSFGSKGHHGLGHMVVGFTTTHAISAYHHYNFEFESRSWQVLSVTGDRSVVSSTNKKDHHNITEILLKVN